MLPTLRTRSKQLAFAEVIAHLSNAIILQEEATLKRVYYNGTALTLMPDNTAYAPMIYTGPQLEDVHIEGKAVGWTHWVG